MDVYANIVAVGQLDVIFEDLVQDFTHKEFFRFNLEFVLGEAFQVEVVVHLRDHFDQRRLDLLVERVVLGRGRVLLIFSSNQKVDCHLDSVERRLNVLGEASSQLSLHVPVIVRVIDFILGRHIVKKNNLALLVVNKDLIKFQLDYVLLALNLLLKTKIALVFFLKVQLLFV